MPIEQTHAEFVLKLANLFGDAGLRSVQCQSHLCQVEVLSHGLLDRAQLLEIHRDSLVMGLNSGAIQNSINE